MKTLKWSFVLGLLFCSFPALSVSANIVCNVLDFGADPSGQTITTQPIQAAIDSCHRAGSGSVILPPGVYLSGTLELKSHVALVIDKNAVLLGSANLQDYPIKRPRRKSYTDNYTCRSLIYAENTTDIVISGQGTIDGQGGKFPTIRHPYEVRPYIIRMVECRHIVVKDLLLQNSAMWVQHYLACTDVDIRKITVKCRSANFNNDGLDIDGCDRVTVTDCFIDSEDDGIALKSTLPKSCNNVSISHCTITSLSNAIKCGTESNGGFQNIRICDCHIYDTYNSGIALEIVDGGVMNNVIITNITMNKVNNPLFIRLGNRARPWSDSTGQPDVGSMRNIILSNIIATDVGGYREEHSYRKLIDRFDAHVPASITGLADQPIRNITLSNILFEYQGGGKYMDHDVNLQNKEKEYPEYAMFGQLPASGLYCRHVEGLNLSNISLSLEEKDERPVLHCQDIVDLFCNGFSAPQTADKNWYYGKNVTARQKEYAAKP